MTWELRSVVIIGGGMMGRSIATKVAQEGLNVSLKEVSEEAVASSHSSLAPVYPFHRFHWATDSPRTSRRRA